MKTRQSVVTMTAVAALLAGCSREPEAVTFARYNEAVAKQDFATAARCMRKISATRPDSALTFYNLGIAELETEAYKRAAAAFEEAARLTTDGSTDALEALARVRMLQGRYDEANRAYEEAMALAGRTARILAGSAAVELRQDQAALALVLLKEALAVNVDEPVALFNMGILLKGALQDKSGARKYFEQFLKRAPESDVTARKKAEAIVKELASEPLEWTSARAGVLLLEAGQTQDKAAKVRKAEEAVQEDPLSAEAWWALAGYLAAEGRDTARTMQVYTRFATRFANNPNVAKIPPEYRATGTSVTLNAVRAAAQSKKWKEAYEGFGRYLTANPHAPAEVWVEYCIAAQETKNLDIAQKAAERALAVQKDYPLALYHLGYVQIQRGNKAEGEKTFRRYLDTLPDGSTKRDLETWLKQVL
ncbi:MAG: tetratricopeptide repeat protein [Kiritimatiellaeota bacterium]|nr:tetratricopeptide repeat protein [Kiritimatiellota bacterium]